jgi:hypothetical protein
MIQPRRSVAGKSRGWKRRAFTALNAIVLTPMPNARVRTASAENAGRRLRLANA